MPTLTINIACSGTKMEKTTKLGFHHISAVGHIWFSLTKEYGTKPKCYGFAPDELHKGSPSALGQIYTTDDSNYLLPRYYTRTVYISQTQYDEMIDFGNDPRKEGFILYYKLFSNNCTHFTWKAMSFVCLNLIGNPGIAPEWCKSNVDKALSEVILISE